MNDDKLSDEYVVQVAEERLIVSKQTVETGRVRIDLHQDQRTEIVREVLRAETVDVVRVPVNREIEGPPPIREEGDVTIYPVMEERLVTVKKLFLKEELRVTRRVSLQDVEREVQLRTMRADITRLPPISNDLPPNA